MSLQQILITVMTNIVVDKSTDNLNHIRFVFYHNINVKENFHNNCQNFRALIDASNDNGKLANRIARLETIVVKKSFSASVKPYLKL